MAYSSITAGGFRRGAIMRRFPLLASRRCPVLLPASRQGAGGRAPRVNTHRAGCCCWNNFSFSGATARQFVAMEYFRLAARHAACEMAVSRGVAGTNHPPDI
ncbi:hypothetical protein KCP69_04680 [Salmonella enterica subsp. enterica]|nr:hypothetical protein KCP69_04680 [Salmonella enterica subsp. enterica]